ncbi:MAG: hypothetical protein RLY31_3135 [Bacteroidota bacterium]|jgi:CBS domain-containing protein
MTKEIVTVRITDDLQHVRSVFNKHSFHHLPVLTTEGRLAGIIALSDYDKVRYLLSTGFAGVSHGLTAKDIMTSYPMHLEPDDTVGLAADIFLANRFHALPVLDDQLLVGLVTTHDLLAFGFRSPLEPELNVMEYQGD